MCVYIFTVDFEGALWKRRQGWKLSTFFGGAGTERLLVVGMMLVLVEGIVVVVVMVIVVVIVVMVRVGVIVVMVSKTGGKGVRPP